MKILTGIYDFFEARHRLLILLVVITLGAALVLISRLDFKEDISDFLPLDPSQKEAFEIFSKTSGADGIYIFAVGKEEGCGADSLAAAIDCFEANVHQFDTELLCTGLTTTVDMDSIALVRDFVLQNIPYFLTEGDYARMDSLMSLPGYVKERLEQDAMALMFPSGPLVSGTVAADPLALFTPVLERISPSGQTGSGARRLPFEIYDSHIFTSDRSRAIAMLDSPFGNSETRLNSVLIETLEKAAAQCETIHPEVGIHILGGPVIAVGNARRIKTDSIIALSLSLLLMLLLLWRSKASLRNTLMLLLSVAWGWLCALGGMYVFGGEVSIIVIGISSVIIGIAINYPLHLIVHTKSGLSPREALCDIAAPLVIGNITTVGAFLTLVPLKSTALRDLGLFASLLLAFTIVFVLGALPHFIKGKPQLQTGKPQFQSGKLEGTPILDALCTFSPEKHRTLVVCILAATAVLAFFSTGVDFDDNISNINYLTDSEREDMNYFASLSGEDKGTTLYIFAKDSCLDNALEKNALQNAVLDSLASGGISVRHGTLSDFLVPPSVQKERLERWKAFLDRHSPSAAVDSYASVAGFTEAAFAPFKDLCARDFGTVPASFFAPLTERLFKRNIVRPEPDGDIYIVETLNVDSKDTETVKSALCQDSCFEVRNINSAVARDLSDNFNYIGWACSLIVFFFLWFSFGRLELALVSFLPMAVSWLWILGIMSILGIKFNIVNIILATFIFGQGDDYTIFITEGCQKEYALGRSVLPSYKRGIVQSALIMFIGIGTLIFAAHPAMHSLAQLAITGMGCVVFMAYLFPPLIFRFLTTDGSGRRRTRPITILSILHLKRDDDPVCRVRARYVYKGMEIERTVRRKLKKYTENQSFGTTITDEGYGETAILAALKDPYRKYTAVIPDPERRRIAELAAEGFVNNLEFISKIENNGELEK